jgi:hypothetical protein
MSMVDGTSSKRIGVMVASTDVPKAGGSATAVPARLAGSRTGRLRATEATVPLAAGVTVSELETDRQRRDALLSNFTVRGEAGLSPTEGADLVHTEAQC